MSTSTNFSHLQEGSKTYFQKMDTVKGRGAVVLAPADAAGGIEVLLNKVATLLEMIDTFDAVAPFELLADDLGGLDVDPLLSHQVLPHLQHRHRVLVWILRIEVIRRSFIQHYSLLPPHLSLSPLLSTRR
ncbi:hypothetical protein ACSBR1_024844 [Camellia fascicularis]